MHKGHQSNLAWARPRGKDLPRPGPKQISIAILCTSAERSFALLAELPKALPTMCLRWTCLWPASAPIGEEKNSININFLVGFPADIPDPYARMPMGSKSVSPPPRPQENTLFGADVHDFRRGRPWPEVLTKNFVQKKFALTIGPYPTDPEAPKNSKTQKSESKVTFGVPAKVAQKLLESDSKVTFSTVFITFESLSIGCTPRGSCNRTPLRRVLGRFSNSKCFLEGFLEGACKGFSVKTRVLEGFLEGGFL